MDELIEDVSDVRDEDGVRSRREIEFLREREDGEAEKYSDRSRLSSHELDVGLCVLSVGFSEKLYAGGRMKPDPVPRADEAQDPDSYAEPKDVMGEVGCDGPAFSRSASRHC